MCIYLYIFRCAYIYISIQWVKCSPMALETSLHTKDSKNDTSLCNTQHYKVCIKATVEQSGETSSTLPYNSVVAIEKGVSGLPSTTVANFTLVKYMCVCVYVYIYIFICVYIEI